MLISGYYAKSSIGVGEEHFSPPTSFTLKNENIDSQGYLRASTSLAQMSASAAAAVGVTAASAVDVDARRHDGVGSGGGGAHAAPPDAGWARVLIGRRGRRRRSRRRHRAKGWRNRQAPLRGPAATVSSRRTSSQRPAAVSLKRWS